MHVRNSDYASCETDLQPRSAVFQRGKKNANTIKSKLWSVRLLSSLSLLRRAHRINRYAACVGTLGCGPCLFDKNETGHHYHCCTTVERVFFFRVYFLTLIKNALPVFFRNRPLERLFKKTSNRSAKSLILSNHRGTPDENDPKTKHVHCNDPVGFFLRALTLVGKIHYKHAALFMCPSRIVFLPKRFLFLQNGDIVGCRRRRPG